MVAIRRLAGGHPDDESRHKEKSNIIIIIIIDHEHPARTGLVYWSSYLVLASMAIHRSTDRPPM